MTGSGRTKTLLPAIIAALLALGWLARPALHLFLVGDSTMADKPLIGNPERGWGQVFPLFFSDAVTVENHARNGRSTKSFLREGRWDVVVDRLQRGDYVFIQFGHNDSKREDTTRYAEPHTDYKANLLRFIRDTREKGATPVLLTPVSRRRFDSTGAFYDVHGDYPGVVREVAQSENVALIDLHKKSWKLFADLGEERTKSLFLWIAPGLFSSLPGGKHDDTHFSWRGAASMASLVVEGLKETGLPLADFLAPAGPKSFVGMEKTILLDNYYNNEWREDSSGHPVRFHYLWHDTTNSGFSQLAKIVSVTGASLDTACRPATSDLLKRASMYIIVDPDTPLETKQPNIIEPAAVDAIAQWVNTGGVLLLLGNDKGNAEFEHFNSLAGRFGIHFNEDSRNRVTGNNYGTGTFDHFPSHPLFNGIRKVYIKELSTLRLQEPATPLFSDSGNVIIAFARVGHGAVFAVGDPWFYNEYMDQRRLPADYDNTKAAGNLFSWLLTLAAPVHNEGLAGK
jgi:lysophospholipase L1-like esterase